jgi:hypothetical protein
MVMHIQFVARCVAAGVWGVTSRQCHTSDAPWKSAGCSGSAWRRGVIFHPGLSVSLVLTFDD